MARPADRSFTPRRPTRASVSGREAIEFLSWHSRITTDSPESFHAMLNAVVFDDMTITRLRHTPATVERTRQLVDSLVVGSTLIFVKTGLLWVSQGDSSFELTAGSVGILSGYEPYTFVNPEPVDATLVVLRRGAFAMNGLPGFEQEARLLRSTSLSRSTSLLLEGLSADFPRPGSVEGTATQRAVQHLLIGILLGSHEENSRVDKRNAATIAQAMVFMAANSGKADLTTADIANASGVSIRHLQRILAATGTSIAQVLRDNRLRAACGLLVDEAWKTSTLEHIALASGFGGAGRMRRTFQTAYGMTPAEYRANPPSGTASALQPVPSPPGR
ncbi:helix-turn-helix domain-containing protein [Compostimonas suwonensis]|uniref:AraC-like protein n=1 Tax=Compostimonas suwonensis TaxID=1048394 RepID=A0A2M9BZR7_9MICO|nr:AraC family transcriptional regulator [Compostimonas suwonensis]PJJ63587.1 AraC-like protein [Compostimonas suwonensis]